MTTNPILCGVVGSTAYGLATPESDVDRIGIYVTATENLFRLNKPKESFEEKDHLGDVKFYEIEKWIKLALQGNPTIMEAVWLPYDLYLVKSDLGQELINIRRKFLCAKNVRNAYLGYATQQFRRLESREDGSFSADTRKRTAKHARHLLRLVHQGTDLYTTGHLSIQLKEPEKYHEFGEAVAGGNVQLAKDAIKAAEDIFDSAKTVLPLAPNSSVVEDFLIRVRRAYL